MHTLLIVMLWTQGAFEPPELLMLGYQTEQQCRAERAAQLELATVRVAATCALPIDED